ncbi:hypothetical protein V6R21_03765 [Limibacter armeniacum]|uniref:hypothetical protein n=1 Tax=Limibacter armeniacum TaxID=466084 RepID=UPI002FE6C508
MDFNKRQIHQLIDEKNINTISLWDHYLSREEFDLYFPKIGTDFYLESCNKLNNFFLGFIDYMSKPIFSYDPNQEPLKTINPESLLTQEIYSPDMESAIYFNDNKTVAIQMSYDFCLSIFSSKSDFQIELLPIVRKYGLEIIRF